MHHRMEEERKKQEQMRYDYLKDISHLREYMIQKENVLMVDYIDVRYFEATKDIDEKTQILINEKISQMALKFNQ